MSWFEWYAEVKGILKVVTFFIVGSYKWVILCLYTKFIMQESLTLSLRESNFFYKWIEYHHWGKWLYSIYLFTSLLWETIFLYLVKNNHFPQQSPKQGAQIKLFPPMRALYSFSKIVSSLCKKVKDDIYGVEYGNHTLFPVIIYVLIFD